MKITVCSGTVLGVAGRTMMTIINAAARRARVKQIIISSNATSLTDAMADFAIKRFTADGTGSTNAANVKAVDPGDGTPLCGSKINYTVEPTYETGDLYQIGLHQRSTLIWTPPDLESEPRAPIGTANGIGIVLVSATLINYKFTIIADE